VAHRRRAFCGTRDADRRPERVAALRAAYVSGTLDLRVSPDHPGMELLLDHLRQEAESFGIRFG
jgi:hypothetical protein